MNITSDTKCFPFTTPEVPSLPHKKRLCVPILEGTRFYSITEDTPEDSTLRLTVFINRSGFAQFKLPQSESEEKSGTSTFRPESSADNLSGLVKQPLVTETTSLLEKNRSTTFSAHYMAPDAAASRQLKDISLDQETDSLRKKAIAEDTIQTSSCVNNKRSVTPDTLIVNNQEGKRLLIDLPIRSNRLLTKEDIVRIAKALERDPEYSNPHIARMLMTMHKWDNWSSTS